MSTAFSQSQHASRIALTYIATGPYHVFFKTFRESALKHFFPGSSKHFFVFTDDLEKFPWQDVTTLHEPFRQWPYPTLMRFEMFMRIAKELRDFDLVYFANANSLVVADVESDVMPDSSGLAGAVSHPFVYSPSNLDWNYERRPESSAYIHPGDGIAYFRGGFFGGLPEKFLSLSETCAFMVNQDLSKGLIARCNDESYLNRYFIDHPPRILDPSYCFAEQWRREQSLAKPRIIMRDKGPYFGRIRGHGATHDWGLQLAQLRLGLRRRFRR